MSRRTSATPSSRNQRKESVWTSMRFGRSLTSRNFEKDKRSRDARRANVTPIETWSRLLVSRVAVRAKVAMTRDARLIRARVDKGLEDRKARAGKHG